MSTQHDEQAAGQACTVQRPAESVCNTAEVSVRSRTGLDGTGVMTQLLRKQEATRC